MLKKIPALLATFLLVGCVSQPKLTNQQIENFGEIFDLKTNQKISFAQLMDQLEKADYVLIGEQHDQGVHHQIEQYVIEQIDQRKGVDTVAFEMLAVDQQDGVNAVQQKLKSTAMTDEQIKETIGWRKWDWDLYRDLIVGELKSKHKVKATNLTADEINQIMQGAQPLKGYYSTFPAIKQKLAALVVQQHHLSCGADCETITKMVEVQQFRDRRMAEALYKSHSISILVAGNNHIDMAMGVPLHLWDYKLQPVVTHQQKKLRNFEVKTLMLKTDNEHIDNKNADYLWLTH